MENTIIQFKDLQQGDKFRFIDEPKNVVRTATQIGKLEIYCPKDDDVLAAYDPESEVYLKTSRKVILIKHKL